MTPGQFFAFCELAEARWRGELAANLAQTAIAFRADGRDVSSSVHRLLDR